MVEGARRADARAAAGRGDPRADWTSGCGTGSSPRPRGNPLALLELPRGLTPAELAGGFGLPGTRPLASRIEQSFRAAARAAPGRHPAAAAARGRRAGRRRRLLLWRAAERLGHRSRRGGAGRGRRADRARRPGALPPSAGALGGLPGRAPCRTAETVHRALAEATDPERRSRPARLAPRPRGGRARRGGGRRAGALGRAGAGPRRRRGGGRVPRAGGRADARPGAPRRGAALAAAQAKFEAGGARTRRSSSWRRAEVGPLGRARSAPGSRGCARRSRSRAARGSDAPPLLLDAARRLEPLDAGAGARDLPRGARRRDVRRPARRPARRARGGRGRPRRARGAAAAARDRLLLDGLATRFTEGYAAGVPPLRRALERVPRAADAPTDDEHALAGCGWPAVAAVRAVGRRRVARARHARGAARARDAGALTVLPIALTYRAGVARPRRRVRRRRGAGRGGRRDRAGDRHAPLAYAPAAARRLARPEARGAAS